jgi:hypothetical protein
MNIKLLGTILSITALLCVNLSRVEGRHQPPPVIAHGSINIQNNTIDATNNPGGTQITITEIYYAYSIYNRTKSPNLTIAAGQTATNSECKHRYTRSGSTLGIQHVKFTYTDSNGATVTKTKTNGPWPSDGGTVIITYADLIAS